MSKPSRETKKLFAKRIRAAAFRGRVLLRHHARAQMRNRGIYIDDLLETLLHGEVIEVYPGRTPYPGCLVYARVGGRPLHAVCALPRGEVVVITVYEPDPGRWTDFRVRRR